MWSKIIAFVFAILLGVSLYFNKIHYDLLKTNNNALIAYQDSLHTFKSTYQSQAGYQSVVVANKDQLIRLLTSDKEKNKDIIDSLTKNNNIQTISQVETKTIVKYISVKDTALKGVKFTKNIHTDWLDEKISVDSDKLTRSLDYRDAYIFSQELKKNKGWFSGSTLVTQVVPKNPDTRIIGITSVSNQINKAKIIVNPAIGFGLNSDLRGQNIRLGWNAGVIITIK